MKKIILEPICFLYKLPYYLIGKITGYYREQNICGYLESYQVDSKQDTFIYKTRTIFGQRVIVNRILPVYWL